MNTDGMDGKDTNSGAAELSRTPSTTALLSHVSSALAKRSSNETISNTGLMGGVSSSGADALQRVSSVSSGGGANSRFSRSSSVWDAVEVAQAKIEMDEQGFESVDDRIMYFLSKFNNNDKLL